MDSGAEAENCMERLEQLTPSEQHLANAGHSVLFPG